MDKERVGRKAWLCDACGEIEEVKDYCGKYGEFYSHTEGVFLTIQQRDKLVAESEAWRKAHNDLLEVIEGQIARMECYRAAAEWVLHAVNGCSIDGSNHVSDEELCAAYESLEGAVDKSPDTQAYTDKIRTEALEEALTACEKVRAYGAVKTIERAMAAIRALKP